MPAAVAQLCRLVSALGAHLGNQRKKERGLRRGAIIVQQSTVRMDVKQGAKDVTHIAPFGNIERQARGPVERRENIEQLLEKKLIALIKKKRGR